MLVKWDPVREHVWQMKSHILLDDVMTSATYTLTNIEHIV